MRRRTIADEHKARVFTVNGIIRDTVLIDGFDGRTWRLRRERVGLSVEFELIGELFSARRDEIAQETDRVLAFAADGGLPLGIRFLSST